MLALAVLIGLVLTAGVGWWWADPLAGLVIVYYAVRESRAIHVDLRPDRPSAQPSAAGGG